MTDRNKFSFYVLLVTIVFSFTAYGAESDERPFQMLIRTTNDGLSSDTEFLIQTKDAGYSYNVDCDNDGKLEATGITDDYTCRYTVPDDYIISISGTFPQLYFERLGRFQSLRSDSNKVIDILQWGTQVWRSMEQACFLCANMIMTTADTPDLSQVTSMRNMFRGAKNFNQYIGDWDVSNVTNMSFMFSGADSFNQPIADWDVSKVTEISAMFQNAESFNQYIGDWDVSSVTDMSWMFSSTNSFNQYIGDWDVSNVAEMNFMFNGASSFNQYIGAWDVSHVTDMSSMFVSAHSFNQYIGNWDVSHVTHMNDMFNGATSFNQYIGNWDVSDVAEMKYMFNGASTFNQYIGDWDVSSVTDMSFMFAGADFFNQYIGDWNVSNIGSLAGILENTNLSTTTYDYILYNWSLLNVQPDVTFDVGDTQYSEAGAAFRQQLIDEFGWTINDGGSL